MPFRRAMLTRPDSNPPIEILPHVDNAPSRRVSERCGCTDTGEVRRAPRGEDDEAVHAVYAWEA